MNKKKIAIAALGVVVSFLLGFLTHYLFHKEENDNRTLIDAQLVSLNKSQIDTFVTHLEDFRSTMSRYKIDEELMLCNQMMYLYKNFPVVEYNIINQRNNEKIISSIIDTVFTILPAIKKDYLGKQYRSILQSLNNKKTNDNIKLGCLYLVESSLINNYLSHIYKNAVSLSYAELINDAPNDVIRLGETYHSQLLFSVKDISDNNNLVEIINDSMTEQIKWNGCDFVETPTMKGNYHHDLLLMITGFYGNRGWKTAVDYEVK